MAITPFPTPAPSRSDAPADFVARADATISHFSAFTTEANALQVDVNAKAIAAALSETNAGSSETAAALSETNASNSETNASNSEAAAALSEANAAASTATMDAVMLGSFTSDPTLDNAGNALIEGAAYWNSVTKKTKIYNGSDFVNALAGIGSVADDLTPQLGADLDLNGHSILGLNVGALGVSPEYVTTNKTLLSTDSGYQIIGTGATYGVSYTLPDARTLPESGLLYIFQNNSAFIAIVNDAAGVPILSISPDSNSSINLEDNSTLSGIWTRFGRGSRESFILGSPAIYNTGASYTQSATKLTSTKILVCYSNTNNATQGTACVLSISGSNIAAGTPVVFESGSTQNISVAMLSETKAIVCYRDENDSSSGKSCILDVSGTAITVGAIVNFSTPAAVNISVSTLTPTKAIVGYVSSGSIRSCVLDISGSAITPASIVTVISTSALAVSITALTSTKALICYRDNYSTGDGKINVLDISGSTISVGSVFLFESGTIYDASIARIDDNKAIIFWSTDSVGKCCVISVAGLTAIDGENAEINSFASSFISVQKLTETKFIACYENQERLGECKMIDISGNNITEVGEAFLFNDSITANILVSSLSETKGIVCYSDVANGRSGTSKTIQILG